MINEQLQEQASLYVLDALPPAERKAFVDILQAQSELQTLAFNLERTLGLVVRALPPIKPPPELRDRVLRAAGAPPQPRHPVPSAPQGANPAFYFVEASAVGGWKALPVPGAFIKVLSVDRDRGFAVLLGRLDRGVRYPAHAHTSPEDFCIVTGDLTVGDRRLGPGDFHHCDAGTAHSVNYSDEGCTLLAVLSVEHEIVRFALESLTSETCC